MHKKLSSKCYRNEITYPALFFRPKMKSCINITLLLLMILQRIFTLEECLQKPLFSTKTPYGLIQNLDIRVNKPKDTCEVIQINMIHRHGNRYPSYKDVKNMNVAGEKINKAAETITTGVNLKLPWKSPFTKRQDKLLSHVGERELFQLGQRILTRFPSLFKDGYSPLNYSFQSSCKLRCTHSANALAAGLFKEKGVLGECGYQPIAIETFPCNNDPKLRFFKICEKYKVDVEENQSAMQELTKFMNGVEVKSVIEKLSMRLGRPNLNLNANDMWALSTACAYELGMYNGSLDSGVCSLFDQQDRQIMEYAYDLKHFYKRSAGHKITYESSCPLLKDVIYTLDDAINNPSTAYNGVFRSSHAETIIPLYALLGVFLDEKKLKADNFAEMKYRQFRGACISPFSGHMYFVLYKCDTGYKVQMYINERLAKIPCCSSKLSCDFEVFRKCYQHIIDTCEFKKMCKIEKNEL
ncbi:multiple inositol polyphosphate phosphatase 1-like [Hydractinia symbiolongicarpus]|uniref:multiple inositol polyphosphate phosphatase 1-like n=1 Tax=Hydractinia symbiolongicarpus TaxID=13093 RepID=UPI00255075AF|nr:multiple inositol polyphosphate phosphatase 1-like [Hydractinia symbiolongicarpus]